MGKDARLRKLRREARQRFGLDAKAGFAKTSQQQHPNSIVFSSGTGEKMSEVLEDFAEPLLNVAKSPDDTRKALLVAMLAWNYSLLNDADGAESGPVHSALLADPYMRALFDFLLARKQQLYPDNKRVILDFQIIPNGTEFHFNVISTMG